MSDFQDHFSSQADLYAKYRPTYPQELYDYILSLCESYDIAWDCATGNGQAAQVLSHYFRQVEATDASESQLNKARSSPNIRYSLAVAERTSFPAQSFDLITVAQALHWFDFDAFYQEVRRVLKPNGILACWGYTMAQGSPEITAIIQKYYSEIVGPYWPEARRHVEEEYKNIRMPDEELASPIFRNVFKWNLRDLVGYFQTWSATRTYMKANSTDPVAEIISELTDVWGDPESRHEMHSRIFIRASRIN